MEAGMERRVGGRGINKQWALFGGLRKCVMAIVYYLWVWTCGGD